MFTLPVKHLLKRCQSNKFVSFFFTSSKQKLSNSLSRTKLSTVNLPINSCPSITGDKTHQFSPPALCVSSRVLEDFVPSRISPWNRVFPSHHLLGEHFVLSFQLMIRDHYPLFWLCKQVRLSFPAFLLDKVRNCFLEVKTEFERDWLSQKVAENGERPVQNTDRNVDLSLMTEVTLTSTISMSWGSHSSSRSMIAQHLLPLSIGILCQARLAPQEFPPPLFYPLPHQTYPPRGHSRY